MNDLIKREDAIKAVEDLPNAYNGWSDTYDKAYIIGTLEEVPSADIPKKVIAQITFDEEKLREIVKEAVERFKEEYEITDRPQGEWKAKNFHEFFCNNCGFSFDMMKCEFLENMKYCPNCGVPKGADDDRI